MKTLKEELIELKACEEAIKWVGEKTPEEAWNTCERGDWMWWLIWKTESATKEQSVRFADFCANNAKERAASAAWAAERAANVAEWSLERKKQADFIRTIFKREDIKI